MTGPWILGLCGAEKKGEKSSSDFLSFPSFVRLFVLLLFPLLDTPRPFFHLSAYLLLAPFPTSFSLLGRIEQLEDFGFISANDCKNNYHLILSLLTLVVKGPRVREQ